MFRVHHHRRCVLLAGSSIAAHSGRLGRFVCGRGTRDMADELLAKEEAVRVSRKSRTTADLFRVLCHGDNAHFSTRADATGCAAEALPYARIGWDLFKSASCAYGETPSPNPTRAADGMQTGGGHVHVHVRGWQVQQRDICGAVVWDGMSRARGHGYGYGYGHSGTNGHGIRITHTGMPHRCLHGSNQLSCFRLSTL